jgi:succinate dehydrogenase / fumarate reductase cytochrome b subunit
MNSIDKEGLAARQQQVEKTRARRPMFLDLRQIAMPVGALTSIGHRISGVVLALAVPAAVYCFALSLRDEKGFERWTAISGHLLFKAAAVIAIWALAHHLLGGLRHLLSDFDIGSPLRSARKSAWFVNLASVVVALLAAVAMW